MINLNREQTLAVNSENQFNLIVAGAGTGKTATIINRVIKLLKDDKIEENQIALLTFSNKAAEEMKERIKNNGFELEYIGTFHAFSLKFLIDFALLDYVPEVLEFEEKEIFFEKYANKNGIYGKKQIRLILRYIEKLKRNTLYYDDLFISDDDVNGKFIKENYKLYEKALIENRKIDYENMIIFLIKNLKFNLKFREKFKNFFSHILIDEYQDTTPLQLELILTILKLNPKLNVFAVGDDDQSIYSFRDVRIENFLHFEKYFNGAKLIKLTKNYRSGKKILDIANSLISKNTKRIKKTLQSTVDFNGEVTIKKFVDENLENEFILDEIGKLLDNSVKPSEIAVLVRFNRSVDKLGLFLSENGIKFKISEEEENKESTKNKDDDRINLMTYHSAKGLEFECVFLPYLGEDSFLSKKVTDIEEERRVFYVGITRAKKKLFLTHSAITLKFGKRKYQDELRFLREIY